MMRFQHQLRRLNETGDLNPKLPSTLQGELRDYQVEGYQWMVRLADDRRLGKTVQPLALILASTLNTHQFDSGDRQAMLDEAGPFDLIVCSYGLLQTEGEKLAR